MEKEALAKSSSLNITLSKSNEYMNLVEELRILQVIRTELQF